jgi:hypothetical protein
MLTDSLAIVILCCHLSCVAQPGQVKMPEPFGVPSFSGMPPSGGYPVCAIVLHSIGNKFV